MVTYCKNQFFSELCETQTLDKDEERELSVELNEIALYRRQMVIFYRLHLIFKSQAV